MPYPRLFTLDEANEALPLIRSITRDTVRCYRRLTQAIRQLRRLKVLARKGLATEAALRDVEQEVEDHLRQLRHLIDELEALGCELRDYGRGVVDFPAAGMDAAGFTVYCWTLGESSVSHWHADQEGYGARRPVPAAVAH